MQEKRAIPAALGIFIGPAIAYLSYLVLASGSSELLQLICFALFLLAGLDLARSGLSLSGILAVLLIPSLPVAIYIRQIAPGTEQHLGSSMLIILWVINILAGALLAGAISGTGGGDSVKRLSITAIGLLLIILASFIF